MELRDQLTQITRERFDLAPDQCSDRQLYEALLTLTRRLAESRPAPEDRFSSLSSPPPPSQTRRTVDEAGRGGS